METMETPVDILGEPALKKVGFPSSLYSLKMKKSRGDGFCYYSTDYKKAISLKDGQLCILLDDSIKYFNRYSLELISEETL